MTRHWTVSMEQAERVRLALKRIVNLHAQRRDYTLDLIERRIAGQVLFEDHAVAVEACDLAAVLAADLRIDSRLRTLIGIADQLDEEMRRVQSSFTRVVSLANGFQDHVGVLFDLLEQAHERRQQAHADGLPYGDDLPGGPSWWFDDLAEVIR